MRESGALELRQTRTIQETQLVCLLSCPLPTSAAQEICLLTTPDQDQPGNRFEGRHQESAARLSQDSESQAPAGAQVPTGGITAPASTGVAPTEPNKPAPLEKGGATPPGSAKVPGEQASLERPNDLGEEGSRRQAKPSGSGALNPQEQPKATGTGALNPQEHQSAGRGMMMSGTDNSLGQSIDDPSVPHKDSFDRPGAVDQSGVQGQQSQQSQTTPHEETQTSPSASSGSERGSGSSQGSGTKAEKKETPIPQEKDYRSTGFAAEGGNFDASASGAGKEAERTLSHIR